MVGIVGGVHSDDCVLPLLVHGGASHSDSFCSKDRRGGCSEWRHSSRCRNRGQRSRVAEQCGTVSLQAGVGDVLASLVNGTILVGRNHTSGVGKRVGVVDQVLIGSSVLPGVGGVAGTPRFRVDGAVLSLRVGRRVLVEDISVEKLASLDGRAIGRRVGEVVSVLCRAIVCTKLHVEGTACEQLVAHV